MHREIEGARTGGGTRRTSDGNPMGKRNEAEQRSSTITFQHHLKPDRSESVSTDFDVRSHGIDPVAG